MNRLGVFAMLGVMCGVLGACGGSAKVPGYVNIPAQEGTRGASSDPNTASVAKAQAAALAHVLTRWAPAGPYMVHLPNGSTAVTYEKVLSKLPGEPVAFQAGEPTVRVAQVLIRNLHATLDIILPIDGKPAVVTVSLEPDFGSGYAIARTRVWNLPVEQAIAPVVLDAPQPPVVEVAPEAPKVEAEPAPESDDAK